MQTSTGSGVTTPALDRYRTRGNSAATDRAPAATAALTGLAGRTPHPHAAPICTVLAMTAYRTGDGTLANVALGD